MGEQSKKLEGLDLYSYEFQSDPVPYLHRLREEDPVHLSTHGFWFLTRYDDVQMVLRDAERFSSAGASWGSSNPMAKDKEKAKEQGGDVGKVGNLLRHSFNLSDPPVHTRLRGLVNQAFSRRAADHKRERIESVAGELVAAAKAKGTFDLVRDLGFHLPIIVASEIIGIPTVDREKFRRSFEEAGVLMMPIKNKEILERGVAAARWQGQYLKDLVEARRSSPQDDLISHLIDAEEEGERLTAPEMMAAIATIFTAAGTTTERMISSGLFILLSNPDQFEALRDDRSLMDGALDEILRFHHPDQSTSTNRRATQDVEMRGKEIKAGDSVRVSLGAANRDPARFPDPDRFDIRRADNKHLSFGNGIHFCLGSALARSETEVMFNQVFDEMPGLTLVTDMPIKDPRRPDRYKEILVKV
ncbi:cytochrome P450 monooxygenase PikC [Rhodobiaceae bacterium]|nr:cytochrome P450 monooxygenase PikC [Rhodobiaceae bacterium]